MNSPLIVAEVSANHMGSLHRCMDIINQAVRSGAHAIKLQTYTADTMVADREYILPSGPWKGRKLWELYQEAHTPWLWHKPIFDHCDRIGIECFSTPFCPQAVDFLERLHCSRYKIASFELTDLQLIVHAARTGKPLILSTGMATFDEIQRAVNAAKHAGCQDLTLLKCTSSYPAPIQDANLNTLSHMREFFGCKVGLSDHTPGIGVPIAAVMQGATLIEKHITLEDGQGLDGPFSLKPEEFRQMCIEIERATLAMGECHYGPTISEQPSLNLRRSVYAIRHIKKGHAITADDAQPRRPANGPIDAMYIGAILGMLAMHDIPAGTPLTWDMLD